MLVAMGWRNKCQRFEGTSEGEDLIDNITNENLEDQYLEFCSSSNTDFSPGESIILEGGTVILAKEFEPHIPSIDYAVELRSISPSASRLILSFIDCL